MRLKKLKSQSALARYLKSNKEDALNLDFYLDENKNLCVPNQRTISYFLVHTLDEEWRNLINDIVKFTEDLAIKNKIIFDVETIKVNKIKRSRNKKTFNNRKIRKMKEVSKVLKKEIYPIIEIPMGKNVRFNKNSLLDILVQIGQDNDFAHDWLKRFFLGKRKSLDSDTFLYHLKKSGNKSEVHKMFVKSFDASWELMKSSGLLKHTKYDVAIDYTHIHFYGKNAQMIVGGKPDRGTTKFYKFATISIVEAGNRIVLFALPVSQFDSAVEVVDKLIKYAKSKIKINRIYVDRGFFSADMINLFYKHKLEFLMPATQNSRIKKVADLMTNSKIIKDYEISEGRAKFNLVINVENNDKKSFATNIELDESNIPYLFELYDKRWGIETSYRMTNSLRAKTSSKNYTIRLFYYMFSVLVYNFWIFIDALVSKSLIGKVLDVHLITARTFAMIFGVLEAG